MRRFWADIRGNVVITFTLTLPVLVVALGLAVDYTTWTGQSRRLQGVADAAAIAAARELYIANASDQQIRTVAMLVANAQIEQSGDGANGVHVDTVIQEDRGAVQVTVSQERQVYFSEVTGMRFDALSAVAVARAAGGGRVCVIGLDDYSSGTLKLDDRSRVTAPECAVYSNATSPAGIDLAGQAVLEAELICSAGGIDGTGANFASSEVVTDCPQIQDPLAGRAPPDVGGCDYEALVFEDGKLVGNLLAFLEKTLQGIILRPGTYCGGLQASGTTFLMLPGIYVIKDGPLDMRANTVLVGEGVGFYLTGHDAVFELSSNTIIRLTAPTNGPMAGLLFFEDREAPLNREHVIRSNEATTLLGTIYLPRGILVIDTNARIAEESAYTAIVARQLLLLREPNLFLNADYDATDVPVPDGLGPVGGNVVLER